jgi:hypothetical protein
VEQKCDGMLMSRDFLLSLRFVLKNGKMDLWRECFVSFFEELAEV